MRHTTAIVAGFLLVTTATAGVSAAPARGETVRSLIAELDQAAVELESGSTAAAAARYAAALERARSLAGADLLVARATDGLADARREEGRWREAETLYLEAAELWERVLGPAQPRLATTLHNLGVVRFRDGRSAEAEVALRRALAIWETAPGDNVAAAENTRQALRVVTDGGDPPR